MERQKIGGQMGKAATKSSPLESTKLSYSLWAYIVTAFCMYVCACVRISLTCARGKLVYFFIFGWINILHWRSTNYAGYARAYSNI